MGIFLNYGGAGSHHGGTGRITPLLTRLTFLKAKGPIHLSLGQ